MTRALPHPEPATVPGVPDSTQARDLLAHAVDEAARLLNADGAIVYLVDPDENRLRFAVDAGISDPEAQQLIRDLSLPIGVGLFGHAVSQGELVVTSDYRNDERFAHSPIADRIVTIADIRSMAAAPLIADGEVLGALGAYTSRVDDFGDAQVALLRALADHVAAAIANQRLIERLARSQAELARQIDSQRRLLQINQRLLSTLEPAGVLELIADGLKSVVWYDNLGIYRVEDDGTMLRPVLARDRNAKAVLGFPIPKGSGLTWWSVEHSEPVLLNDALADPRVIQIPNTPLDPEAIIIVPLVSGEEVIGALNIGRVGRAEVAFTELDFELVQLFGTQAAVAVTNARLYEALRERAEAQRSLAQIASEIASLRDPQTVLQHAVADAARLLRADRAQVNLAREGADVLDPPIASAPTPPSANDVVVPIGSGIAGLAAAECRVCWTGDYLADSSFSHDEGDERIREQGIHSMMSAPLREADRLIGTITVQSKQRNAFSEEHGELLKLLADQAAIALTNARLYAELGESERRYRHLVDYSPDIVWSVDAEGRFTFLSDSLEVRTGWKAAELIGRPFTVLADRGSIEGADAAWAALLANPSEEQRVRLDLPLANGDVSQAEVAMAGTVVDGRFVGAHGSVRDISERERLEGDLRRQAAELAASQERAHLARELHDSVTQALFSMGLTLRSLELLLGTDVDASRAKVAELRDLQKDALAEMRTLIFELRPASLETDGLVQALRTHATAVQRRTGLALVVDAEPIPRLPLATEEALYRIGQEAIHNIVKHANASRAGVRLARAGDLVRLTVTDDGAGFSPEDVPRGHLGLLGMRQRLDLIGGELRIESTPGRGTTIHAEVPARIDGAE